MPRLNGIFTPERLNQLERGHTQSPRRRRASDSALDGAPPAHRPRPDIFDSFRRNPELVPTTPLAVERAIAHLTRDGMASTLRQDLRTAVLSLPDDTCDLFAHQALTVCADISGRPNVARMRGDVLQALVDRPNASCLLFVAKEAAQLVGPHDSDDDRIQMIEKLGTLKHRIRLQMDTLRGPLLRLPDSKTRCRVLCAIHRWPPMEADALRSLLQAAEFLLIAPDSNDFRALSDAAKLVEVQAARKGKALPPKRPSLAELPLSSAIPDLPDAELDDILDDWPYNCDYDLSPVATPRPSRASSPMGKRSLYAHNDESVMQRRRHLATFAAYKKLQTLAPMKLPTAAMKPVLHRMLERLHAEAAYRLHFKISAEAATSAWEVWQRPRRDFDHLGPLSQDMPFTYLGGLKVSAVEGVAQVANAVSRFEDVNAQRNWTASRPARELMFTGLINNLSRCQEAPDEKVPQAKRRVCQVGVTQQALEAVAGYYPISLEHITPAALLTALAEETFGAGAVRDEPTLEDLIFFRNDAMARARSIFTPEGAHLPDAQGLEEFEQQLMAYLYFDHDMDNKAASLNET